MTSLRRRLASCALAVCCLQLTVLLAAPVSACCEPASAAPAASAAECCPAGSHPPGQCPMHRDTARPPAEAAAATGGEAGLPARHECRMSCSHQDAAALLFFAPLGTIVSQFVTDIAIVPAPLAARLAAAPIFRTSDPLTPPPEVHV